MKFNKRLVSIVLVFTLMMSSIQLVFAVNQTSAEKLNHLGLLLNISEEELAAELSREVGLTMILKALGYTQEDADKYVESSPFVDTQGWSSGWASLAYHLNITTGTSSTTFSPKSSLSEREFLTFLLRALGHDSSKAYTNTESLTKENGILSMNDSIGGSFSYNKQEAAIAMYNSLKASYLPENIPLANLLMDKGLFSLNDAIAIGLKEGNLEILRIRVLSAHEFQVVFNQTIDTNKVTFLLEDGIGSYGAIASWNSAKNIANIVTADDMINGTYTLTASYLSTNTLKYIQDFKIVSSFEKELIIDNTGVVLEDNAGFNVRILDSYNNDIYDEIMDVSAVNQTLNTSITISKVRNGYYQMNNLVSIGSRVGDVIDITINYNNKKYEKQVTVVLEDDVDSFEFINPLITNGRLQAGKMNLVLDYVGITKTGADYKIPLHIKNSDGTNNSETIGDLRFTSSNSGIIDVDELKVDALGVLRFNLESGFGTTVLTVQNTKTGIASEVTVAVYANPELSKVIVQPFGEVVALGEKVILSVTGYDQFGARMDFNYISGLQYNSSDEEVVSLSNTKLMNNEFSYTGTKEGTTLINIYSKESRLLLSQFISIEAEAEPVGILEVMAPKYFEASVNASYVLTYNDLYVSDQFSREYDLDNKDEIIHIAHEVETTDNMNFGSGNFASGGLSISGTAEVGTGSYRFKVADIDYAIRIIEFTTIASEDIASYQLDDISEMEIGLLAKETLTLRGLTASDKEIVLANDKIDFITISDPTIADVTFDKNIITIVGKEGGTVTLTAWKGGGALTTASITILPEEEE